MLSREDMDAARERLPIVYVDVVPVRVDTQGTVITVGLLLRAGEDGQIKRALVSGAGAVPRAGPRGPAPAHGEGPRPAGAAADPARAAAVHRRRVLPDPRGDAVPRSAGARGVTRLRRAGGGGLGAAAGRAGAELVHARGGARPGRARRVRERSEHAASAGAGAPRRLTGVPRGRSLRGVPVSAARGGVRGRTRRAVPR